MKNQRSIIKIHELPKRPQNISQDELIKVFGGCVATGLYYCTKEIECCNATCIQVTSLVTRCL